MINQISQNVTKLLFINLAWRIFLLCSGAAWDIMFEDYDRSTELFFTPEETQSGFFLFYGHTIRWDSHFFLSIAQGGYEYEQNHAFFPLYPILLHFSARVVENFTAIYFQFALIMCAWVFNIVFSMISSGLMYLLSMNVIRNQSKSFLATLLFIFSPSSIFFNAIYTEGIFTFFTMIGLFFFYMNWDMKQQNQSTFFGRFMGYAFVLKSLIWFSLATFTRSNGMFFIVIVGYLPLSQFIDNFIGFFRSSNKQTLIQNQQENDQKVKNNEDPNSQQQQNNQSQQVSQQQQQTEQDQSKQETKESKGQIIDQNEKLQQDEVRFRKQQNQDEQGKNVSDKEQDSKQTGKKENLNNKQQLSQKNIEFNSFWAIFWAIVSVCFLCFPFVITLALPVLTYCLNPNRNFSDWCFNFPPNVYSYIQDVHWQVGFLESYKLSRTFFIIWGIQTVLLIGFSLYKYIKHNYKSFFTLNIIKPENLIIEQLNPIILYTVILYIISAFYAHIQSCTRFFSSNPVFYWFLVEYIYTSPQNQGLWKTQRDKNGDLPTKKGGMVENSGEYQSIQSDMLISNDQNIKIGISPLSQYVIFYIILFNTMGVILFANFLPWT